jgi:hypothetical protein
MCKSAPAPDGAPCGVGQHCDGGGACVSVTAIWAKRFGAAQDQSSHDITVDLAGNPAITGSYQNVVDLGGGPLPHAVSNDAFVAKLDPAGGLVWNRAFNSAQQSAGNNVRFDRFGNAVVSGGFWATVDFGGGPLTTPASPGVFVAKYASDGAHLWSKGFGTAGGAGAAYQSSSDAMGNVYVAVFYTGGAFDFGCGPLPPAGGYDALMAKLDPDGNCLWSKRFGDAGFQQNSAAAVDPGGNVFIAGILTGTVDFGGGPLTSAGGQDVFVAKFDPLGNHLWSKRFGDAGDQLAIEIAATDAGGVAVVGWFSGTLDFGGNPLTNAGGVDAFVATLDGAGSPVWSKRFGAAHDDGFYSVAVDKWGDVGVTGFFHDAVDFGGGPLVSAGGSDIVVAKLDSAGNHLWSQRFGDAQDQVGLGIAFDGAARTYLTGTVAGSVDFGTGPLVSAGGTDIFVAKLPP